MSASESTPPAATKAEENVPPTEEDDSALKIAVRGIYVYILSNFLSDF